jgi:Ca2+-transporting ATPase
MEFKATGKNAHRTVLDIQTNKMGENMNNTATRFLIPALFLAGIVTLSIIILRDFFLVLAWAFIIAYVAWSPYCWLKRRLKNRANLSAAVMTALIAAIVSLTLFWLAVMLRSELKTAYQTLLLDFAGTSYQLPEAVRKIPWLGDRLQFGLEQLGGDTSGLSTQLAEWAQQGLGGLAKFLGNIGRNLMDLGFVLVTVFFCFRNGEAAIAQLQLGLIRFLGQYQQAIASYDKAIEYKPDYQQAIEARTKAQNTPKFPINF